MRTSAAKPPPKSIGFELTKSNLIMHLGRLVHSLIRSLVRSLANLVCSPESDYWRLKKDANLVQPLDMEMLNASARR